MAGEPIVGTWTLETVERVYDDGRVVRPLGDSPVGRLTYTSDGYMQAILMPGGRRRFESGNVYGTAAEREEGARHFMSYAGRYVRRGNVVLHYPDASFYPNWVGQELQRSLSLNGDTMVLSTEPAKTEEGVSKGVLVWKRPIGNDL